MSIMAKCNANFVWLTPAGMKIRFALGKVTSKRAGKGIIKSGSGVQINIIDKSQIDVHKSVTALMPNFVHSLDASCIHELTFDLFTQLKNQNYLPYEGYTELPVPKETRLEESRAVQGSTGCVPIRLSPTAAREHPYPQRFPYKSSKTYRY